MIKSPKILYSGILYYSTSSSNSDQQSNMNHLNSHMNPASIEPWFITGFVDGEGSFSISIIRHNGFNTGWCVKPIFQIGLHKKDLSLLEQIKSFFSVGSIYKDGSQMVHFRVESVKDLVLVISHFDKYPLITQKQVDYLLFKQVFNLINRKEHLTMAGLQKIISIKFSINRGLSDKLNAAFPKTKQVEIPSIINLEIKDPHWLAGFVSGEGCFFINLSKSSTNRLGFKVELSFTLTQHSRDELLMRSLIEYFGCGNIYKTEEVFRYRVVKFSNINEKIIPFFSKFTIQGVKQLDFLDFSKAAEIIKAKAHLTKEGLVLLKIRKIKSSMNKGRIYSEQPSSSTSPFKCGSAAVLRTKK